MELGVHLGPGRKSEPETEVGEFSVVLQNCGAGSNPLGQWSSTFLVLWLLFNTVAHVAVTPNHKVIFIETLQL